ncbi:LysR substrate-binding domain-containing protein [Pectobacterium cacticida]|uniref:LysR substrate-binding domain-containing protein n=1 Tax=Pectobacterium cacticida TaxID=69221 RepID=UPI002FF4186F
MQIEPLPPLHTLIAFECVARHGSISRAAEELNLTQSSISRQILQLEEALGCKLFTRTQRRVTLTPRGDAYITQVRQQLSMLSHATAEVMGWNGLPQVTIACTSAVGELWIAPRLSALHRELPDLQIRMKTSDSFSQLRSSEFDLAIFYLREAPSGFQAHPLFDEICYPMCAPSFLPRIDPDASAEALLQHMLLIQDEPQRDWTSWSDWFAAQQVLNFVPRQTWRANNYPFLVQAALQGDGILLGWEGLVQDRLNSGQLVPAHSGKLVTNSKCYLLTPQDRYTKPIVRHVIGWFLHQHQPALNGQ